MRKVKIEVLPPIPLKKYFRMSEACELTGVKDYILRNWEKEFPQLRPLRRGAHRAYRRKDILLARRIRELVYVDGYKLEAAKVVLEAELEKAAKEEAAEEMEYSDDKKAVHLAFSLPEEELAELKKSIDRLRQVRYFLQS